MIIFCLFFPPAFLLPSPSHPPTPIPPPILWRKSLDFSPAIVLILAHNSIPAARLQLPPSPPHPPVFSARANRLVQSSICQPELGGEGGLHPPPPPAVVSSGSGSGGGSRHHQYIVSKLETFSCWFYFPLFPPGYVWGGGEIENNMIEYFSASYPFM